MPGEYLARVEDQEFVNHSKGLSEFPRNLRTGGNPPSRGDDIFDSDGLFVFLQVFLNLVEKTGFESVEFE